MPTPEDRQDSLATDDDQKGVDGEIPPMESGEAVVESMDTSESTSQTETYENPFLKPPKKVKLKIFSHQ